MGSAGPAGALPSTPGLLFLAGWRHRIRITFLPGKQFAIAYFSGTMVQTFHQMMMLMGGSCLAVLSGSPGTEQLPRLAARLPPAPTSEPCLGLGGKEEQALSLPCSALSPGPAAL